MSARDILPKGAVKNGDIVTFGKDPLGFVVSDIEESDTGILAFKIRPRKAQGAAANRGPFGEDPKP